MAFAAIENPIAFSADAVDGVGLCLAADTAAPHALAAMVPGGGTVDGMVDMLRQLAVHGHAPVPLRVDPRAELAGRRNVGGIVARSSRAPGVPLEAWSSGAHKNLVVVTNQAVRMLLASELGPESDVDGNAAPGTG
jgi:hypothetical protein